jgi:hypothetical protein
MSDGNGDSILIEMYSTVVLWRCIMGNYTRSRFYQNSKVIKETTP